MPESSQRFFTVAQRDGRWSFIDPDGKPFYSLGVDCVTPSSVDKTQVDLVARYGGRGDWLEHWADAKLDQLRAMKFNTLGAWHEPLYWERTDMPKTVEIRMSRHAAKVNTTWGFGFPDVFDPSFDASIHSACTETLYRNGGKALVKDPGLIGWYTDNELHWWGASGFWGGDDQGTGTDSAELVDDYIALGADKPGKKRWVQFLRERYGSIEKLNETWDSEYASFDDLHHVLHYRARSDVFAEVKRGFLRLVAETYFQKTSAALKLYCPNQLNLGTRVVGESTPRIVLEVMGKYVDVVSFNTYSMKLPEKQLGYLHEVTGRPILLTEFAFCAGSRDGFVYNTNGANGVLVANQHRRCELYDQFVKRAAGLPFMLGTHWFAMYDYGHREGLIGNYGLLKLNDEPWAELCAAVAQTHEQLPR